MAYRSNVEPRRHGNTMVLVVGILVLLAIIATSYLSRTHAGRVTAISQQRASLRDDNARAISEFIGAEISKALFVRPIDIDLLTPGALADSNHPRLTSLRLPLRYGVDPTDNLPNGIGFGGQQAGPDGIPDYPYNFAPYWVVPFTNWPDPLGPLDRWPKNHPNSTFGQDLLLLYGVGEGNPAGYPGFGDTRWLADLEPLRLVMAGPDGVFGTLDDFVVFSHWRHMVNIARPENGWRICRDISDVTDIDADGMGGLVLDLSVPVEQWLAIGPFNVGPVTGDAWYDPGSFWNLWLRWFNLADYQLSYTNPGMIPANVYKLNNLDDGIDFDGNGDTVDWYERPEAEFIHDPASARWHVSRVLADADGDGITDSFWFLAPATVERGIRQVVAVRIVDNSGMVNAGVATGFVRSDPTLAGMPRTRTLGLTPADLVLTGELLAYDDPRWGSAPDNHWNVGFYDNPLHWHDLSDDTSRLDEVRYDDDVPTGSPGGVDPADLWARHLEEVGLYPFV
ncbi:MAG: hypothetical protein ACYSU7_08000, partial [Planctomycetota bacterium]